MGILLAIIAVFVGLFLVIPFLMAHLFLLVVAVGGVIGGRKLLLNRHN